VTEASLFNDEPLIAIRKLASNFDRGRIPVDRQHATLGAQAIEYRATMSATPESTIEEYSVRLNGELLQDFRSQHWLM
jgi:hypothetical protein